MNQKWLLYPYKIFVNEHNEKMNIWGSWKYRLTMNNLNTKLYRIDFFFKIVKQYFCFYSIFNQINAALVSLRNFFQNNPKLLNGFQVLGFMSNELIHYFNDSLLYRFGLFSGQI